MIEILLPPLNGVRGFFMPRFHRRNGISAVGGMNIGNYLFLCIFAVPPDGGMTYCPPKFDL
jgi:hypothetical protein